MRKPARLRYADVASTLALLLALGGTAYAVTELPANSVGNAQLRADAVSAGKIRAGAVGASELAPGAVTGADVAADSVGLADLAGTDVTGKLSFSVGIWDCEPVTLTVAGAKAGQIALFSFTAPDALPEGIATSVPSVSAGKVALQFCNTDTGEDNPIVVTDAPFRLATFD